MNNKDIVKYFYEVIVSENLLDELSKYICHLEQILISSYLLQTVFPG